MSECSNEDLPECSNNGFADGGSEDMGESSSGSSACLCPLGLLLFPISLAVLGWNEKNAVCTEKMFVAAENAVVAGECSGTETYADQLVFWSCPVDQSTLQTWTQNDTEGSQVSLAGFQDLFSADSVGISVSTEMYQCVETKRETKCSSTSGMDLGGRRLRAGNEEAADEEWEDTVHEDGTVERRLRSSSRSSSSRKCWKYEHTFEWLDTANTQAMSQPEKCFGSTGSSNTTSDPGLTATSNPNPNIPLGSQAWSDSTVSAEEWTLPTDFLSGLQADTPVALKAIPQPPADSTNPSSLSEAHFGSNGNELRSCSTARVGCVRAQVMQVAPLAEVSAMSRYAGNGVYEEWAPGASWMCDADDSTMRKFRAEGYSLEGFMEALRQDLNASTWALRFIGIVFCVASIYMILSPIAMLLSAVDDYLDYLAFIPCVGPLFDMLGDALEGVGICILWGIACVVGVSSSLLVMSIVWIAMRPIWAVPFVIMVAVLFSVARKAKRAAAEKKGRGKRKSRSSKKEDEK